MDSKSKVTMSELEHVYSQFFFQAEDDIRDIGVTGVQTCALPISHHAPFPPPHGLGLPRPPTRAHRHRGTTVPPLAHERGQRGPGPQFVSPDFQGHFDIIGEELARSQALRHGDGRTIYLSAEMSDGVQSHVAFQGRGNPTAYASPAGQPYPLLRTPHSPVQTRFKDDVLGPYRVEQPLFFLLRINPYQLLVEGDGQRRMGTQTGHLGPLVDRKSVV